MKPISPARYFIAGGTMPPDAPSYVVRAADRELLDAALEGEYCYILTPRQMGKSSLMARTARRLAGKARVAIADLSGMGTIDDPRRWYYTLAFKIHSALKPPFDLKFWWDERADLTEAQQLGEYLKALLETFVEPIVIFADEIDTTISLKFAADFFALIRACFNKRALDPGFARLSFVLLGVATPAQLISDQSRTPFNVGRQINLSNFTRTEASGFEVHLRTAGVKNARGILNRALHWTAGQPYLTQAVIRGPIADEPSALGVDRVVERLFFSPSALTTEVNLKTAADRLSAGSRAMLDVLRAVAGGGKVAEEPTNPAHALLKLTGVVWPNGKSRLAMSNRIYKRTFNTGWVSARIDARRKETFRELEPAFVEEMLAASKRLEQVTEIKDFSAEIGRIGGVLDDYSKRVETFPVKPPRVVDPSS